MAARRKSAPVNEIAKPEEHTSIHVRKIKNGWLASHSGANAKGEYYSEEVYHPTKPELPMPHPRSNARSKFSIKRGGR